MLAGLSFCDDNIGDKGAKEMLQFITDFNGITRLDLSSNGIGYIIGAHEIANAVKCSAVAELDLSDNERKRTRNSVCSPEKPS